jgi:hydrogenase maturation protease
MDDQDKHVPQAILIIGIGNEYRSDDAVGLVVAQALQARKLPHTSVIEATGEGMALLEAWQGAEKVILVDAVTSRAPAGTIYQLDAQCVYISPDLFALSTHAFSVAGAVELARVLGSLPQQLMIYGIEGKNFVAGTSLSPEVEHAAHEAVESIVRLVQGWLQVTLP